MAEPILSESVWERGWSDTKHGLGVWQFWVLEVFGGGLMAVFVNPDAALIFVLGMAVALWIGATASAPIRQRNEARQYRQYIQKLLRRQVAPFLSVTYDSEYCRKIVRYKTGLNRMTERVSSGGGPIFTQGISIRVCASNENPEPATNCEGFLGSVEFREDGETEFRHLPLYEPHKLPWALDEFTKVTIKKDVPKYLGIVSASQGHNSFGFRSDVTSHSTKNQFYDTGEYRFHGSIAADTGGTTSFVVGVNWNGQWDEIEAWLVENT